VSRPVALVLRALGLGDLLAGVPALRGLRRALPEHQLILATEPAMAPLAGLVGAVDSVLGTHGLEPLPYVGAVDVAVDLHGKGPLSQPVLAATHPGSLVSFACPEIGVDGPQWRRDEHERARWCRLVTESLGEPTDPDDLRLPPPAAPRTATVVVHPGAAYAARRWPHQRFAAVAAGLARAGHHVVVTGSTAERPLAQRVALAAGLGGDAVLAGRTDVVQLAEIAATARLVVCGDTGMAHLASAFATPSVVLFGPTPPAWWGPPEKGPHMAIWHGDRPGDPWAASPDPALLRIDADEVLDAATGLLAGAYSPGGAPAERVR
jgi:ADP-heptose:LPS heptosyltransferase